MRGIADTALVPKGCGVNEVLAGCFEGFETALQVRFVDTFLSLFPFFRDHTKKTSPLSFPP